MRTIEVSDEVYERIERKAEKAGLSINDYVEARLNRPLEEREAFPQATLEKIDRGAADVREGRVSSWDEVDSWIGARSAETAATPIR